MDVNMWREANTEKKSWPGSERWMPIKPENRVLTPIVTQIAAFTPSIFKPLAIVWVANNLQIRDIEIRTKCVLRPKQFISPSKGNSISIYAPIKSSLKKYFRITRARERKTSFRTKQFSVMCVVCLKGTLVNTGTEPKMRNWNTQHIKC